MTAKRDDIRFDCDQCGQRLVVDATGAGLTTDCPICNNVVTVPEKKAEQRNDSPLPSEKKGRHGATLAPAFADPKPEEIRDELIDASMLNGKLLADLTRARDEIARLQQECKLLGEEHQHLIASTTHIQAELKTFQTERPQLKSEITSLRQRLTTAEETTVNRDAELAEERAKVRDSVPRFEFQALGKKLTDLQKLSTGWEAKAGAAHKAQEKALKQVEDWKAKAKNTESALAEARKLAARREREVNAAESALHHSEDVAVNFESRAATLEQALTNESAHKEQVVADLATALQEAAESKAALDLREKALQATTTRLSETEAALNTMRELRAQLEAEQSELRRELEDVRMELANAGDLKMLLARTGLELQDQCEKLRAAEESNRALTTRCEELRRESDSLRRDLSESHAGREIIEIRSQLEAAAAERERAGARISSLEGDVRAFTAAKSELQAELDQARQERDGALEKSARLGEAQMTKDNEVLRGIVARLNSEVAQRTSECLRLKRARYALKLAYLLFGIGMIGVVAFAIKVLPHALHQAAP